MKSKILKLSIIAFAILALTVSLFACAEDPEAGKQNNETEAVGNETEGGNETESENESETEPGTETEPETETETENAETETETETETAETETNGNGGEGNEGGEGGDDVGVNNPVYSNGTGKIVNGHNIISIEYNANDAAILVTYDEDENVTYTLTDNGEGGWTIGSGFGFGNDTIFGMTFGWLTISDEEITLVNMGEQVMATFYADGHSDESEDEGGDEGGNDDDADDVTMVFVRDPAASINGHTVSQIKWNQTKSTITVTYDGSQTVTHKLSDWGDGDWKLDDDGDNRTDQNTLFGSLFCIKITPVGDPTTLLVDLSGSADDVSFTLEGVGGDAGEGEGGDNENDNTGDEGDDISGILTYTNGEGAYVNGLFVTEIVYDASADTIHVSYDDTSIDYNLRYDEYNYNWIINSFGNIFGCTYIEISATEFTFGTNAGPLATFYTDGQGDEGGDDEGGAGGGTSESGNPIYTPLTDVTINMLPINSIEYDAANASIIVTYDGTETATYSIFDYGDGTWGITAFSTVFGSTFSCLRISDTQIEVLDMDENPMATFYHEV